MAKSVRMADIAAKLGISIVSVSKGLAGKDGVSEEMRAKILATAQEMGYIPPAPKSAELARSENIGILVADRFFDENQFYSALYRAVLNRCTALGYSCLLELVGEEAEAGCIMPTLLTQKKVNGLIFMGEISRRYLCTAITYGLPFLLLDFYDETISADSVLSDNTSGAYMMTEHLLNTGRTKIGFVGSIGATSSIMDRYLGYCKALLTHGLEPNPAWRLEDRDASGRFIPLALPREMPQAFVCNNDEAAFNLVETLRRAGYEVPRDVAVTGYDDFRWSTLCRPPLTTYRVDVETMGATAVDQLRRKLLGKTPLAPTSVIPGAFVRREST